MKKRVLWEQNKKKQKGARDWQGLEILSYCIELVTI